MNNFFPIGSETYNAIEMWLEILKEYDQSYIRDKIVFYKSRRIQEKAFNKKPVDNSNLTSSNFSLSPSITEKEFFKPELDERHSIEIIAKTSFDRKLTLHESLEDLAETIEYIEDDEDDNIFDLTL
ncbi:MAG: hypothetical protein U0457_09895 [Candidatus Sericytochromatia bacterium]